MRSSSVQEFTRYLHNRWQDGCHNAAELYREIRERGYSGNYNSVRRTIQKWRDSGHPISVNISAKPPSASMVARLLLNEVNMTPELECFTKRLLTINPIFRQARKLGQEFVDMIRNRRIEMWSDWVSDATSKAAPLELRSFGESLKQDEQAVKQAISCDWSNGQVEGHVVNRLKTIKRQMYGRGGFELLRRRMLLKIPR
jgi:transposase